MNRTSKLFAALLSVLFLAACQPAADQKPVSVTAPQDEMPVMMETMSGKQYDPTALTRESVNYYPEKPDVVGYLAMPPGEANLPAIILIHEWWGMNEDIQRKAREFAAEGYVALAVDLYEGKSAATPEEAGVLATGVRENVDEAFNNLKAAVDYLKSLNEVDDSRIASVGWCFGGQWSYDMARNDLGTKVSIMYYGRFHPDDDLSQMKALILGHFGEEDTSISVDDVKEFQVTLGKLDKRHEIYIYENAGHAFANNDSDAFVEEAAREAWNRSLDFLHKYL